MLQETKCIQRTIQVANFIHQKRFNHKNGNHLKLSKVKKFTLEAESAPIGLLSAIQKNILAASRSNNF